MVRPRRARVATIAALGLLLAAIVGLPAARAEPPSFSLTWDAPPDCPDAATVRHAVERLLAGESDTSVHVDARATVARGDRGSLRVKLVTVREGRIGERTFEATSCRSLADATALIVALTIDPTPVAANQPAVQSESGTTPTQSPAPP